jgi:hypothetical protein
MLSIFINLMNDCFVHLEGTQMKGWQSREHNICHLQPACLRKKFGGTDQPPFTLGDERQKISNLWLSGAQRKPQISEGHGAN